LPLSQAALAAELPPVRGEHWLNTEVLQSAQLEGKVVMVEFWTFGCHNCQAVEPYVKQWHQRYAEHGLVIIGVHSPEFAHEKSLDNVRRYVEENGIHYPVVLDNDFSNWRRFGNRYWPTLYLADRNGTVRYRKIGEGSYRETERWIQQLLAEPSSNTE
jgi:thiol-disulfide isomerase/thioredoxin